MVRFARSLSLAAGLGLALGACASTPSAGVANPADQAAPAYATNQNAIKARATAPLTRQVSFAEIDRHLSARAPNLRSPKPGVWHLSIDGVMLLLIAEPSRVRIMAPIFALNQLESVPRVKSALMVRLLQANFDDTIDARYAIYDDIVFAAVTQPRERFSIEDLDRFLVQIVNLHKNTFRNGASAYSSSPPTPGSIEVDPRLDESLTGPRPPSEQPRDKKTPESLPGGEYERVML